VFTLGYFFVSCLGPAAIVGLVALIAMEFAGGFVASRDGAGRTLFAGLATLDLVVLPAFSLIGLLFFVSRRDAWPEVQKWAINWLLPWLAGAAFGTGIIVKLWRRTPWPEWVLPLRGRHARRFLAAAGITLLVAVSPLGIGLGSILWGPAGGTDVPWGFWVLFAGLPFYFAPLWHVLVND